MGGASICSLYKIVLTLDSVDDPPGGVLSYMAYTGTWYGQGMVFGFSVLIRIYNFMLVCTQQGTVA